MSLWTIQFFVVCLVCLFLMLYLKPWRLKTGAFAVVVTPLAMAYYLSWIAFLMQFQSMISESQGYVLLLVSILLPGAAYLILRRADPDRDKPNPHYRLDTALDYVGLVMFFGFVGLALLGKFLPSPEILAMSGGWRVILFKLSLLFCGLALLLRFALNLVLFAVPNSSLAGLIKENAKTLTKVLDYSVIGSAVVLLAAAALRYGLK